jgi:hypothetical protein
MGQLLTAEEARVKSDEESAKTKAARLRSFWDTRFTRVIKRAIRMGLYEAKAPYDPNQFTLEDLETFVSDNNLGYTLSSEEVVTGEGDDAITTYELTISWAAE